MKLRDMPVLSRRFRFAGSRDTYCIVTPKCWPSRLFGTPRPWLGYLPEWDRTRPKDDQAEPVLTLRTPSLDEEYARDWVQFCEAESEDERGRALEILEKLFAWHGAQEK